MQVAQSKRRNKMINCPFCGEAPSLSRLRLADDTEREFYLVDCLNPDCKVEVNTHLFKDPQEAISAWNSRIDTEGGENE
jgi:Lar family restriction alleviation protein